MVARREFRGGRPETHDKSPGKKHAQKAYGKQTGQQHPQADPDGVYFRVHGLQPDIRSQTGKRADHDRIAMRKNNNVQYAEKQCKADSHQSVHHAEHESVHDELRQQNAIHKTISF